MTYVSQTLKTYFNIRIIKNIFELAMYITCINKSQKDKFIVLIDGV